MGRKRFLSTDMSGNPKIAAAGAIDTVAALSYGLLVLHMDDWGRRRADVRELKLNVFQALPHVDTPDIERILSILADEQVRLLVLYEVGGRRYIQCEPESFYESQTYIKAAAKQRDSSKCPPPQGHPWADYWPESDWRKPTGNPAELHSVQKSALGAESNGELQPVQNSAPSVLHLSSPLSTSPHPEEEGGAPAGESGKSGPGMTQPPGGDQKGALPKEEVGPEWYRQVEHLYALMPGRQDMQDMGALMERHNLTDAFVVHAIGSMIQFAREWEEKLFNPVAYTRDRISRWAPQGVKSIPAWDRQMEIEAERRRKSKEEAKDSRDGRGSPRGNQPPQKRSNVLWRKEEKTPEQMAELVKKFPHIYGQFYDEHGRPRFDGDPGPDPPPDDGRESA